MKKRFLSAVMIVCMLFTLLPAGAWATEVEEALLPSGRTYSMKLAYPIESNAVSANIADAAGMSAANSIGTEDTPSLLADGEYATWEEAGEAAVEGVDYTLSFDDSVCTVYTALGLAKIANYVDSKETSFIGWTVKLGNDIDLSTAGVIGYGKDTVNETNSWDPIGEFEYDFSSDNVTITPFQGVFDGDGHKVQNLYINASLSSTGLFSCVFTDMKVGGEQVVIKDVTIEGADITGNFMANSFLVGFLSEAIITGCTVDETSVLTIPGNDVDMNGGFVGGAQISGLNLGGELYIRNCINNGTISGGMLTGGIAGATGQRLLNCVNNGPVSANMTAGGIAGYYQEEGGIAPFEILNCVNNGSVSTNNGWAGGIAGEVYVSSESSLIAYCYNTGSILGGSQAGGIAGDLTNSQIENCYNIGTVSSRAADAADLGGIAGHFANSSILNCYNTGMVLNGAAESSGGIVGSNSTDVENCFYLEGTAQTDGGGSTSISQQQLATEATFTDAGWDFSDIWAMDSYLNRPVFSENREPVTVISTPQELADFRDSVNDGEPYAGKMAVLAADIDLSELCGEGIGSWTPIGSEETPFMGTFDGRGNEISGLYIDSSSNFQGLFGYVGEDGVVRGVNVSGTVKGAYSVGGVVGRNDGIVENCYNGCTVSNTANNVGGVVGFNNGTVKSCYNDGAISGGAYVGGVIGNNNESDSRVENCYNKGTVNGVGDVGGITGANSGTIVNSYNVGSVSGTAYVGGISGYGNGTATSSYYLEGTAQTDAGGGEMKTAEQLAAQSTFTGWDFSGTWVMDEWLARPILQNPRENGGAGTEEDPYVIPDLGTLERFQKAVESGNSYEGQYVALASSIDMSSKYGTDIDGAEVSWTPIGSSGAPFLGTFDGAGYEISGLYINADTDHQGLFGYLGGDGIIQNLTVSGMVSGRYQVAGILGYNYGGSVINCVNNCAVTGATFVGGIVGGNIGSGPLLSSVQGCSNYGTITCTNASSGNAGGIVGSNSSSNVLIDGCTNYGAVAGASGTMYGYTGGIAGMNYGTVKRCVNEIDAQISGGEAYSIGGIVGYNFSGISNCYNLGALSIADGAESAYVGGVAGVSYQEGYPAETSAPPRIENCYSYTDSVDSVVAGAQENSVFGSYYLADAETAEANGVTGKTAAQFASGEVAYLLQGGQADDGTGNIPQVWGQTLSGETPDAYPVLTDESAKALLKVSFMVAGELDGAYTEYAAAYTNPNGTVSLPEEPESEVYEFERWSQTASTDGTEFTASTVVSENMTVYAVGQEMYGETDSEKTITVTYGTGGTQDLSEYMTYAGETEASGKFTYTITGGNTTTATANGNTVAAAIDGDTLTIPADTNADTYTLTIQATEKQPVISLLSVNYGTGPVTFTLTVTVAPAMPVLAEGEEVTAARVRRGQKLSTSGITGVVNGIGGQPLEGTWTWKSDREMEDTGTFEETAVFTPTDTNYAPFETVVSVTVYRPSSGGGSITRYTVTFNSQGGSKISSETVNRNAMVTEPSEPTREGYTFEGWFTDKDCTEAYDFNTKVTKNITLYAKWTEEETTEPVDPQPTPGTEPEPDKWENPFNDVAGNDWFYDAVQYAVKNGLFGGVTKTEFAPNEAITRGMLVTVLWRAEGQPVVNYLMTFEDVDQNAYYAEAVRWAASQGIVLGHSDKEFAPDDLISREQLAAILERYADFKGIATDETGDLARFTDAAQVSGWALGNVQWAVGAGLITGRNDGSLDPQGSATRAEAAAILQRFLEK